MSVVEIFPRIHLGRWASWAPLLECLTEREWKIASRVPPPLIEYGHQSSIGMEEIGENSFTWTRVLIGRGHSRDAICHLSL